MLSLKTILEHLEPEDIRCYTVWTKRTRSDKERLDLELVTYIKKNKTEDEFIREYYANNRNAYYRLKNKVVEDIGKSLVIQYWNKDEWIKLVNLVCIARLYHQKQLFNLSLHQLEKAEKLAFQLEDPQLIDWVLTEIIRMGSYLNIKQLTNSIAKRNENRKLLFKLHQIDDITALLENRIRTTQNLTNKDQSVIDWVNNYIDSLEDIQDDIKKSRTLRFKIAKIIVRVLVQEKKYADLENYLKENIDYLKSSGFFTQSNYKEFLELMIYLLNAMYYNKKYQECLTYSAHFLNALEQFDRLYYSNYIFYYYNNLINIYSAIDPLKALATIDEYEKKEKVNKDSYNYFYILIQRMMLKYQLNNLTNALKTITKIKVHPFYEKIDRELQIKLYVSELMLNCEDDEMFKVKNLLKDAPYWLRDIKKQKPQNHLHVVVNIIQSIAEKQSKSKGLVKSLLSLTSQEIGIDENFISISLWAKRLLQKIS